MYVTICDPAQSRNQFTISKDTEYYLIRMHQTLKVSGRSVLSLAAKFRIICVTKILSLYQVKLLFKIFPNWIYQIQI